MVVVRIRTDEGPFGLGEAVPLALRGGPELSSVESELVEDCGPALAGVELEPLGSGRPGARRAIEELLERCRTRSVSRQALAAIDLALHDLAGRLAGEPVWRLLGATGAIPVVCNGTLWAGPPERVAARARELVAAGFETLKLKVGTEADMETVTAVRDAVGGSVAIRVDANGAWSPSEAIAALRGMEPIGLELIEQPAADLAGLAEVRAAGGIPIVADESVAGPADAEQAAQLGACDATTIKIAKVGGIAAALEVAGRLPAYLSSALDGPIGIAAAAHLAQVLPRSGFAAGLAHGLATSAMFATDPASIAAQLDGDRLLPPPGPGLGVELDEEALEGLRTV
jgi:L-alanine-DL-glutamate epimerase-like enolase superfamily enzyme